MDTLTIKYEGIELDVTGEYFEGVRGWNVEEPQPAYFDAEKILYKGTDITKLAFLLFDKDGDGFVEKIESICLDKLNNW